MSEARTSILEVNAVNKTFRGEQGTNHVLDEINLTVKDGDFTTIIGPSGCGKSTLLKIVAGLDTHYEGDVLLKGKRVDRPSQEKGKSFRSTGCFLGLVWSRTSLLIYH